jgi:hypothetical protein
MRLYSVRAPILLGEPDAERTCRRGLAQGLLAILDSDVRTTTLSEWLPSLRRGNEHASIVAAMRLARCVMDLWPRDLPKANTPTGPGL